MSSHKPFDIEKWKQKVIQFLHKTKKLEYRGAIMIKYAVIGRGKIAAMNGRASCF